MIDIDTLATCDNCARLFEERVRRYYCGHCDRYYYICPVCSAGGPHCRFCGVPLARSSEKKR